MSLFLRNQRHLCSSHLRIHFDTAATGYEEKAMYVHLNRGEPPIYGSMDDDECACDLDDSEASGEGGRSSCTTTALVHHQQC